MKKNIIMLCLLLGATLVSAQTTKVSDAEKQEQHKYEVRSKQDLDYSMHDYCTSMIERAIIDNHRYPSDIIIKKDIPFAEQLKKVNTIYVICDDIDLDDRKGNNPVQIPKNCKLEFRGGSLNNGVIQGDDLFFDGNYDKRIYVTIKGKNNTPDFRLYNTEFLCNQLSSAYANCILMEDAYLSENVQLHSGLSSMHNNRLTIDSSACVSIFDDGIYIRNIGLYKNVGSKLGQRFAIDSKQGKSNILIDSCYITGAIRFANDKGVKNCRNLTISNSVIDCDFTKVHKRPSGDFQKDIITIRGMRDVFVYNNKIRGVNVHRFWKSTGLVQSDSIITNHPSNICIHNNEIECKSIDGNGKQLFDFFAGTKNVSICSNSITCSGYTIVFEDKTATRFEDEIESKISSQVSNSIIYIMNNTLKVKEGRVFRYSLGSDKNEVFIINNYISILNPIGVSGMIDKASASVLHNTFENMSSIKISNTKKLYLSFNSMDGILYFENVSMPIVKHNKGHFICSNSSLNFE